VLAGHLDTVPHNDHPEPAMEGNDVIGLGTTDMKGALAVMLTLAERLPAATAIPVGFVFYECEEVAWERNGLRPLFELEPWLGEAELALLLEPTANRLELGCLGSLHASVTFRGVPAHSARPWMGENAIHAAAPFLERIASIPPRQVTDGPVIFREVVSVTLAEGGHARNVIPDRFRVNVNLRFPPDRSLEDAETYLRSLVPQGAAVEMVDRSPAAPARAEAPGLDRLIRGSGLEIAAKQAWTDVSQFAARGVPAANLGPGIPELAHRRDERVPVKNLVESYEVLSRFLTA
jgi:succinyl-diaminopimelate desuccinylase